MTPLFYLLFELYPGPILQSKGMHDISQKKGKNVKKGNLCKNVQNLKIFLKRAGDCVQLSHAINWQNRPCCAICWYFSFLHFKTSTSNLCHKQQQEIYVTLADFGF